eukprot:4978625-Amphidinium_carterae.1
MTHRHTDTQTHTSAPSGSLARACNVMLDFPGKMMTFQVLHVECIELGRKSCEHLKDTIQDRLSKRDL